MSFREALGLVGINVFYLGVGSMLLWCLGACRSWSAFGRLAGVAYFIGIAALVIALTAELAVGIKFGSASILTTGGAIAVSALMVGLWLGRGEVTGRPSLRLPRLSLISALWTGGLILYFEALYRASALAPVGEWDAWWVWTIRAKALFYFGDIGDVQLVNGDVSDYPSYPPGLSLIHAAAFEAMGSDDAVSLHVQHWALSLGFVAAVLGLLLPRVRSAILLPFVVIAVSMPLFIRWSTWLLADLLLAFQVALSAILIFQWLERRERWRLAAASVLLGSSLLTKREAFVVVACVLVAALAASYRQRRYVWPRVTLAGFAAVALAVPWWVAAYDEAAPSDGPLGVFDNPERIWPSLSLVTGVIIDADHSLGAGVLAGLAVVIALRAGVRTSPTYLAVFLVGSLLSTSIVLASEPLFELSRSPEASPVQRLVLVSLMSVAPLTAVVLSDAVSKVGAFRHVPSVRPANGSAMSSLTSWAVLVVFALAYPVAVALA